MSDWTPQAEAAVLKWWNEGLSGAQCVLRLWDEHRILLTRNAVLGKMHRLRKAGEKVRTDVAASERSAGRPAGAHVLRIRSGKVKPMEALAEDAKKGFGPDGGVAFADLKSAHCRFGFVSVGQHEAAERQRFCGAKKKTGSSYCERHHALCHDSKATRRAQAKKRNAADATTLSRVNYAQRRAFG